MDFESKIIENTEDRYIISKNGVVFDSISMEEVPQLNDTIRLIVNNKEDEYQIKDLIKKHFPEQSNDKNLNINMNNSLVKNISNYFDVNQNGDIYDKINNINIPYDPTNIYINLTINYKEKMYDVHTLVYLFYKGEIYPRDSLSCIGNDPLLLNRLILTDSYCTLYMSVTHFPNLEINSEGIIRNKNNYQILKHKYISTGIEIRFKNVNYKLEYLMYKTFKDSDITPETKIEFINGNFFDCRILNLKISPAPNHVLFTLSEQKGNTEKIDQNITNKKSLSPKNKGFPIKKLRSNTIIENFIELPRKKRTYNYKNTRKSESESDELESESDEEYSKKKRTYNFNKTRKIESKQKNSKKQKNDNEEECSTKMKIHNFNKKQKSDSEEEYSIKMGTNNFNKTRKFESESENEKLSSSSQINQKPLNINFEYTITSSGKIFDKNNKILPTELSNNKCKIILPNSSISYEVKNLVFTNFIGEIFNGSDVINIDGNIENNDLSNLKLEIIKKYIKNQKIYKYNHNFKIVETFDNVNQFISKNSNYKIHEIIDNCITNTFKIINQFYWSFSTNVNFVRILRIDTINFIKKQYYIDCYGNVLDQNFNSKEFSFTSVAAMIDDNNITHFFNVDFLVYYIFINQITTNNIIIHINGNKDDNRLQNLKLYEFCEIENDIIVKIIPYDVTKFIDYNSSKFREPDDYIGKKIE